MIWTLEKAVEIYGHDLREWLESPVSEYSEHFRVYEIVCRCGCGLAALDERAANIAEMLRTLCRVPLLVSSGCRCMVHNAGIGGAVRTDKKLGSMHLPDKNGRCHAIDIVVPAVMKRFAFDTICVRVVGAGGYGIYGTFNHLDTGVGRDPCRRWVDK